ncbi:hypothetical protein GPA10_16330 [Streptomyces sp. p1417]|uniref:Uncharacterized protein n=1 Tax=Streptomyces typhae TaxID=2681492 RepID=A0A6L6WXQ4_9ACTN|nr:hypothetical protein [Streptomyces typhae]MVO86282.1 hypothetical protein [Streptomyces typhae]
MRVGLRLALAGEGGVLASRGWVAGARRGVPVGLDDVARSLLCVPAPRGGVARRSQLRVIAPGGRTTALLRGVLTT